MTDSEGPSQYEREYELGLALLCLCNHSRSDHDIAGTQPCGVCSCRNFRGPYKRWADAHARPSDRAR